MGRPRSFDREDVVEAAQLVFWERGYDATGIDDIEAATGLRRSSIYAAFGTKRGLFDAVVDNYERTFIGDLLQPLEADAATPRDAVALFLRLAELYEGELGRRGCLIINAIGELAGRFDGLDRVGAQLIDRYCAAFANTLAAGARTAAERRRLEERAGLLCASVVGSWTASRIDGSLGARQGRAAASLVADWYGLRVSRRSR